MFMFLFTQSVFVFLTIFTSGLQYLIQRINYKRDLERIERFVGEARAAAWGPKMIPIEGKRKVQGDCRSYIICGDLHRHTL